MSCLLKSVSHTLHGVMHHSILIRFGVYSVQLKVIKIGMCFIRVLWLHVYAPLQLTAIM